MSTRERDLVGIAVAGTQATGYGVAILIGAAIAAGAGSPALARSAKDAKEAATIVEICDARRLAGWQASDLEGCYREAIAIDTGNADAAFGLGRALWDGGRFDDASAVWSAMLERGAKGAKQRVAELAAFGYSQEGGCVDCALMLELSRLRAEAEAGELRRALRIASEAAARWPERWEPLAAGAAVAAEAGDLETALSLMREATDRARGPRRVPLLAERDALAARVRLSELERELKGALEAGDVGAVARLRAERWGLRPDDLEMAITAIAAQRAAGQAEQAAKIATDAKRRFRSPAAAARIKAALAEGGTTR